MTNQLRLRIAVFIVLASLNPATPAAEPAVAPVEESITLPKFEVRGNAICSYGIGIVATWDKKSQTIGHVYVDDVSAGSTAERIGLQRGDEILSINGKKISDMKGGMKRGSDLFELLVNQPAGRMVDLEVTMRVVKKIVLTATP
jgi:C-terminal processing protease CtpA/Prc